MVCKVKLLVMCFWTPSQEVSFLQEPADRICLATKSCQAILEIKSTCYPKGKVPKKRGEKTTKCLTNSFMYVCVAGNGEMLVFFLPFFPQQ